jgi:peroxiredoxin Q/BCP
MTDNLRRSSRVASKRAAQDELAKEAAPKKSKAKAASPKKSKIELPAPKEAKEEPVAEKATTRNASKTLSVGDAIPNVVLKDQEGNDVNILNVAKKQTVVLFGKMIILDGPFGPF